MRPMIRLAFACLVAALGLSANLAASLAPFAVMAARAEEGHEAEAKAPEKAHKPAPEAKPEHKKHDPAKKVAKPRRKYGWRPSRAPPDPATRFSARHKVRTSNPATGDLRPLDVPIYDQEQEGSCTAHGIGGAVEFYAKNVLHADFMPSRQFIYWYERYLEGTTDADDGAAVSDGVKVVTTLGVPPESDWPYTEANLYERPSALALADAKAHVTPAWSSIDTTSLDQLRTSITDGHPVVFGFTVYASINDVGPDGLYVPSGAVEGGHCVEAVGYSDAKQAVLCRNSWGVEWAMQGYFWMPYSVYTDPNITSDAHTLVASPAPSPAPTPSPTPAPTPTASITIPATVTGYAHNPADPDKQGNRLTFTTAAPYQGTGSIHIPGDVPAVGLPSGSKLVITISPASSATDSTSVTVSPSGVR